jgi:hypothetical protein
MARPKRSDDLVDRERLLGILKCCRHDLASAMARMRINSPLYNLTAELLTSIDPWLWFSRTGRTTCT